jgi:hypothetical protein
MKQANYENTPRDFQQVIPEGSPQCLEEELQVKGLKISE